MISRKIVRSGAGSEISGARHHGNASLLLKVDAREGLAAENAIPENAYRSQRIVVPELRRVVIVGL